MTFTNAPKLSTHTVRLMVRGYAERYVLQGCDADTVDEYASQAVADIQAGGKRIPGLKSQIISAINQLKREVVNA